MSSPPPTPTHPETEPVAVSSDERTWGMLCHLSGLAILLAIPFAHIIAPLIIWLIKKDEMPFVNEQGKESLNFQISVAIYLIASVILLFVGVGFVVLPALIIFDLVVVIVASVKANQGIAYRYPLCIRFIS